MEAERLQKPVRTLRKGFKNLKGNPGPKQVHELRTEAREIEAQASALKGDGRKARRLLKAIKPVRKAAGHVRDLDVLTMNAMSLAEGPGRESVARLVKRLRAMRARNAAGLLDVVKHGRATARRRLKRYGRLLQLKFADGDGGGAGTELEGSIRAAIEELTGELRRWPELNAETIHRFRVRLKALRSLLRLEPGSGPGFVRAVSNAKSRIGEWHDWQKLRETAGEILDAREDRALLAQIDQVVERKLEQALAASNALRRRYL